MFDVFQSKQRHALRDTRVHLIFIFIIVIKLEFVV